MNNPLKIAPGDHTSLITNPLLNKGMAFTEEERDIFGLHGLLPPRIATLAEQSIRSYNAFKKKPTNLDKYLYLRDLQDSNETLFYHLVTHHIEEMMPIIYTPTVGLGCQLFSHIYRRPRGLFISYPYQDHIDQILANPRFDQTEIIVVSDGERILGLGDQGAGGMGIPIGKLALYTACAGIHPKSTLPILLDTGTNNPELITDPLYIGWPHERIRHPEYEAFIAKFVAAVKKRFPHVLLQWEDFAQQNSAPILEQYRNQLCTFNDDIQGTAAIATATLFAAIKVTHISIRDQRVVIAGAGSAGCGIGELIMQAMIKDGLTSVEAKARIFLINRQGLLLENTTGLLPSQMPFVHSQAAISHWQLANANKVELNDVVKNIHPTLLIGVSGQANFFTKELIQEMATHVERPIIFPLSNPTSHSEATPADLMAWTNNRAVIGTGSPFGEIIRNGQPFRVDQTNNAYIFPGIGLGLISVKAKCITDKMFMIAAKALAECSPAKTNPAANLLPSFTQIREVSFQVALAIAQEAIKENLAADPCSLEELAQRIRTKMWVPAYVPYKTE